MNYEISGERLVSSMAAALASDGQRALLYQDLLEEPLLVCLTGQEVQPGPCLQLEGCDGPTRLFESMVIGNPVVALFSSSASARQSAAARDLWPDGVERLAIFDHGKIFPLLLMQAGVLICNEEQQVILDAGELAALAERATPQDYLATLQSLASRGQNREIARKLSKRMLYVLGTHHDGMVFFAQELPVFLNLSGALGFAHQLSERMKYAPEHAVISGMELFELARKHKLTLLIDPGPGSLRLKPVDLRF